MEEHLPPALPGPLPDKPPEPVPLTGSALSSRLQATDTTSIKPDPAFDTTAETVGRGAAEYTQNGLPGFALSTDITESRPGETASAQLFGLPRESTFREPREGD